MTRAPLTALMLSLACLLAGCRAQQRAQEPHDTPEMGRATAPFAVSVRVDSRTVVRTIPATLYGTNVEWFNEGNGLWDAQHGTLNERVVAAAGELGPTLVRFPGGALADFYHWRDGVGPEQARPLRPHGMDEGQSVNHFGTDELLALCQRLHAQPLLSVNLATGTPDEAADWIRYVTQKDPAATLWELGNEPYMKDKQGPEFSAEQYAETINRFAGPMRTAAPQIQLIAAGGLNFGPYRFNKQADWDKVLLTRASASFDYLAVHDGYAPIVIGQEGAGFYTVYQAMLAFPTLVEQNLREVSHEIDTFAAPGRASHIRLAVTEWGPLFHALPSSPWVDHAKTLGSALFVARMLQTFVREPRLDLANFFKLTEPSFLGWIGPQGERKAPFFAMEMFTRHFGSDLVETSAVSPMFSSRAVGVVAAVPAAPLVSAVSSLSADHTHLYVNLVNTSFGGSADVTLTLAGFNPRAQATRWQVSGTSPDENNGDDLLRLPGLTWTPQIEAPGTSSFARGHAGTVRLTQQPVSGAAAGMHLTVPPLSITTYEFVRDVAPQQPSGRSAATKPAQRSKP